MSSSCIPNHPSQSSNSHCSYGVVHPMSKLVDVRKAILQYRCGRTMKLIIVMVTVLIVGLLWFAVAPMFSLNGEVTGGLVPTEQRLLTGSNQFWSEYKGIMERVQSSEIWDLLNEHRWVIGIIGIVMGVVVIGVVSATIMFILVNKIRKRKSQKSDQRKSLQSEESLEQEGAIRSEQEVVKDVDVSETTEANPGDSIEEEGGDGGAVNENVGAVKLGIGSAYCLAPWMYRKKGKGEDRVFSDILAGRYPTVIVTDGASNFAFADGSVKDGGGAAAAEAVSNFFKARLERLLSDTKTPADLGSLLSNISDLIERTDLFLRSRNAGAEIPGSTTLLFAILYSQYAHDKTAYWIYGYLGDGDVVLISPQRMIKKKWPAETWLLTPHKLGDQPVLLPRPQGMEMFAPIVGVVPYCAGDILYVASDGIDFVSRYLRQKKQLTFGQYLWKSTFQPSLSEEKNTEWVVPILPDPIAEFEADGLTGHDDISVGVIWTEDNP